MRRRAVLVACVAAPGAAMAQSDWRRVAVPYVTPQAWLRSLDERWYAPRAAEFAAAAQRLRAALGAGCEARASRAAWRDAMVAWERLAAVPTGALIERRSARALDFQPTRPASIERAIAQAPADLSTVGAPALGLPALEWLLWRAPRSAAACAYAERVAGQLQDEARALAAAWQAPIERHDEAAQRDFATLVNQLVGGVATLRWAQIGKPRREGRKRWPRATSGLTRDAWQARAQALRTLLEFQGDLATQPLALETFLRGRGLNPLADRVRAASARMGAAVSAASPTRGAAAAEQALAALEAVLGNEVAPKLEVSIGFSDADGD